MTEIPLLSPFSPPAAVSGGQGYFDLVIRPKAVFQNLGDAEDRSHGREGLASEESIQSMLDYIAATMNRLQQLVVTLKDPVPTDAISQDVPLNADREDVELVSRMFPQAAVILVQRLGRANWKRRQYLKEVRHMMQNQSNSNRNQIYSNRGGMLHAGTIDSRPVVKGFLSPRDQAKLPTDRRRAFSRYTSDSETASHAGTLYSTIGPPTSTAGTSVADSVELAKPSLIPVPEPPFALDEGNSFQCPYCAHLIIVGIDITSDDDWIRHVFADIEPYMCTFANDPKTCIKVEKTFGSRQKWFSHELDTHRSNMVWYCQSCAQEFETDEIFESHILRSHDHRLEPDQLSLMASLCKRYSVRPWSSDLCPLCKTTFSGAEQFCAHLAVHLEQIALTSMQSKVAIEEPVPVSPIYPTTPSEYDYRSNFPNIDHFVSEQHKRLVAEGHDEQGRAVHGLEKLQTGGQASIWHEDTILPPNAANTTRGTRPAITPRRASYSYLEQARNLKNARTGQVSPSQNPLARQTMLPHGASPSHICTRTMAPPKNQDFVGRRNDMAKVHHELERKGSICILNGVGGLGKSALAVEYTYLFEPWYDYIFWVQAETPMRCAEAYSQIALVCVPDTDLTQEQDRLVMLSREFLEQTSKRWLLVFDNVDHWRNLQSFLPDKMSSTCGSVLITANKVDTSSFTSDMKYTTIDLGTLGLEESRSLLLNATSIQFQGDIRNHPEYKLAGDVAKMAERLPLALSLIGGYMLVSNLTLTQFVELWNERPMTVPSDTDGTDQRNVDPDVSMDNVWSIGLREVTSDARELLNILAFFDSDNIQKDLLVGAHTDPLLEILHSSGVFRYKRMTEELSRRNLIKIDKRDGEEALTIHRKLQTKVLQDLNKNGAQRERAFAQAFLLVRTSFPTASPIQVPEPEKWPICRKYLLHVLSLRKLFNRKAVDIAPSLDLARLFSDGGIDLWERGLTQEGLELLRSAEDILDQIHSTDVLLRASIHVIISLLIQNSGLLGINECKARITSALTIRREYRETTAPDLYTRNDEILLYNAISDYGCVLLQYHRYQEAEPLFAECFQKYQSWDEPEEIPYEYGKYFHHMAFCRMYNGHLQEAVTLGKQGLHWVAFATGQDSAASIRWKFDLACLTLQSGDRDESMKLHEEILGSRIRLHGKHAYLTLQSYYALGACSDFRGAFSVAETYFRTVMKLAGNRNSNFPEAALARTQFHLSQVLSKQNKNLVESQSLAGIAREFLTREHPLKRLEGVPEEHELVLFDYLQPVLDGRFTSPWLLKYLQPSSEERGKAQQFD